MELRRFLGRSCLVGLLLAGHAAAAAERTRLSPAQLMGMFEAICLATAENPAARTAVATDTPWNLGAEERDADGTERFRSVAAMLALRSDGDQMCGVTSEIDPAITLVAFRSELGSTWGFDDGVALDEPDSRAWIIGTASGNQFIIGLKVSDQSGSNLATLTVQKRRPTE